MSKYFYSALVVMSLFTFTGAIADEVSRSSTTQVGPDYSSTSTTTTNEGSPTTYSRESTTTQTAPLGEEVVTKKTYKKTPLSKTSKTTETTISR